MTRLLQHISVHLSISVHVPRHAGTHSSAGILYTHRGVATNFDLVRPGYTSWMESRGGYRIYERGEGAL